MKQFTKALDKSGKSFEYITTKFPALSESKIKEGIFIWPQIRELFNDNYEENHDCYGKGSLGCLQRSCI